MKGRVGRKTCSVDSISSVSGDAGYPGEEEGEVRGGRGRGKAEG